MARDVLVVGGTGPSGVPIVDAFLAAGDRVTVFHSGAHEADFIAETDHIHADSRDADDIARVFSGRRWDIAVCTSGRLRALALELAGKVRRLVGITGQPVYLGTMNPTPLGTLPLPIPEDAPRQYDANNYTGKVAIGEDQLFEQHAAKAFEAVVVRYPGVYGARGHLAHEWAVVKRILDGRAQMLLPQGGITHFQRGYIENLGRLVYLAATVPAAAGEAFNSGDERVMSARGVAEAIVHELGAKLEFIDVPADESRGFYPLAQKSNLILDFSKARRILGYKDVVDVERATRATARWLFENPGFGPSVSPAFGGNFDYDLEDRLIAAARRSAELYASAREGAGA
ncbi:MAG: NAD-dependent epimerase/dehydratase family protein [Dehalococcoidia bacterium]